MSNWTSRYVFTYFVNKINSALTAFWFTWFVTVHTNSILSVRNRRCWRLNGFVITILLLFFFISKHVNFRFQRRSVREVMRKNSRNKKNLTRFQVLFFSLFLRIKKIFEQLSKNKNISIMSKRKRNKEWTVSWPTKYCFINWRE